MKVGRTRPRLARVRVSRYGKNDGVNCHLHVIFGGMRYGKERSRKLFGAWAFQEVLREGDRGNH